MSDNITKRVGLGTAYGFAKAGGYEGTVAEFTELLGNIAIDLARIENLSVTVTTLPAGSQATASLNGSVLSLGIPKGDKGDKGNTGDTGSPAGFGTVSATVDANIGTPSVEVMASGSDTAKNFAFAFHNLKGQKGDKGDTGEVSEAELAEALEDFAENGTVANAEQLTTKIRANDQTPYLFRTSGGSVDIGDREYINGIVGGTVAWNQLVELNTPDATVGGITVTFDRSKRTATLNGSDTEYREFLISMHDESRFISGHKYYVSKGVSNNDAQVIVGSTSSSVATGFVKTETIVNCTRTASNSRVLITIKAGGATFNNVVFTPQIFDLTQMFGGAIADYIYSLEQANAGAGVAFFKSLFPKPYYAYNSGELKSVSGLVSHDMVGFNALDKSGLVQTNVNRVDSDYISVVPNTVYCFRQEQSIPGTYITMYDKNKNEVHDLARYDATKFLFTTTSETHFITAGWFKSGGLSILQIANNDVCINLSWDGSEDGNYEPYQKWSYPLDTDLELRGIPKLDASNNLYYDGDTYESDGTVTRKYGIVDLGTLDWSYVEATHAFRTYGISDLIDPNATSVLCQKYPCFYDTVWHTLDKIITTWASYKIGNIIVKDTAYSDAATFKSAMSGVYLIYPLATPTTETADPFTSPQIVNDFGTEEFVIDDTINVPIPVGNNTDYPIDLKAKVEMAPNSPDGDGDYIVRQTNGTNEYVALANNATIQNILSRLEALEG